MSADRAPQVPVFWRYVVVFCVLVWPAGGATAHAGATAGGDHPGAEWVILAHGFFSTSLDMRYLDRYLQRRGYRTLRPGLPTTLGGLEACSAALEKAYATIPQGYSRLHLVGHSMGGLIIRQFLAHRRVANLGRCVLIATPNRGTPLAEKAIGRFGLLVKWMGALEVLRSGGVAIPPPQNQPPPQIGVIGGWIESLSLGTLFLEEINDGRVPLNSVTLRGMTDFKVLPFAHNRIHHKQETADLVVRFLQTGSFR